MKRTITVWIAAGVGIEYECADRNALYKAIARCLELECPFQVGHVFGNLDGSHPRIAPRIAQELEDRLLAPWGKRRTYDEKKDA